ncbi:MAG: LysM peptidoglycan-binding domain-containing protein [Gallionella sp.]|nr:LysM peptidoglycan-binding domain-containing protein [Gallionella sp.]
MRKIISLICFLFPVLAFAGETETQSLIRSDAPDQYTIVKGDTLWDISGKFFKDPWKWPHIWGMNKNTIKDPHWIYPGTPILLDRANGTLIVGSRAVSGSGSGDVVKLFPQMRTEGSIHDAIPTIPSKEIEPFLSQPLVVADEVLPGAPTLVGLPEKRFVAGEGDIAYVKGLSQNMGNQWQLYRPGKTFIDPDTKEVLGHEAVYLGAAEVKHFGDVSTVIVTEAKQEILVGDHLASPAEKVAPSYLPRSPSSPVSARVISVYGGLSQAGQNTVITLNKGARDGLQSGHVLALYSKGVEVKDNGKAVELPDERYGLLYVFRVFDKVSYALVMQTHLPVQLLDRAKNP